jgi:hypothetical protein
MRGPAIVTEMEREVMDSPFACFRDRIVAGGTVTDADVNEWVEAAHPRSWLKRLGDWLLEVFSE